MENNSSPLKKTKRLLKRCYRDDERILHRCHVHENPPISANQAGQKELDAKDGVIVDMCISDMFIHSNFNAEYGTVI